MLPILRARPQLAAIATSPATPDESSEPPPIYTAAQMMELPPVAFLDKDKTIQVNGITMVYGQPGAGKSQWNLSKLEEVAQTDQPVMLITGEAQGGIPDRLRALQKANSKPLSSNFYVYPSGINLMDDASVQQFIDRAAPLGLKLVSIDTLAACAPGMDENSGKDTGIVLNNMKRIQHTLGCAVLLIHHTTKDGTTFRGHSSFHGNIDQMFCITSDDGQVVLTGIKTRELPQGESKYYQMIPFVTRRNPETGEDVTSVALVPSKKVIDDPRISITGNQRIVLEHLEPHERGLTTRALEDSTGLKKVTLWRAINKLAQAKFVATGAKGEPIFITDDGRAALAGRKG